MADQQRAPRRKVSRNERQLILEHKLQDLEVAGWRVESEREHSAVVVYGRG